MTRAISRRAFVTGLAGGFSGLLLPGCGNDEVPGRYTEADIAGLAAQRERERAASGKGRFGPQRYRGYRGLAELPWFEIDAQGQLRCVADDFAPAIDIHCHFGMSLGVAPELDLHAAPTRVRHLLDCDATDPGCELDLDVYINANFTEDDLWDLRLGAVAQATVGSSAAETQTIPNLIAEMDQTRVGRALILPIAIGLPIGDDSLEGEGGDDVILGGPGHDDIDGDEGEDFLDGGAGNDYLDADDHDDDDAIPGELGDLVLGGPGNDTLRGSEGVGLLDGEGGNDTVLGKHGNDFVLGGADNDNLFGGSGNDILEGGPGSDFLDGGSGFDQEFQEQGPGLLGIAGFMAGFDAVFDHDRFFYVDPGNPTEDRPARAWVQPYLDMLINDTFDPLPDWLPILGDFNVDGRVDNLDYDIFLPDLMARIDSGVGTDLNFDGIVNIDDFNMLLPLVQAGTNWVASEAPEIVTASAPLTNEALAPVAREAVARWEEAFGRELPQLDTVTFVVADLPGLRLGQVAGNTVWIDPQAAGHGWFVDATPGEDEEWVNSADGLVAGEGSGAENRIDLLSVIAHELRHVLDTDPEAGSELGTADASLAVGTRVLPALADSQPASDPGEPAKVSRSAQIGEGVQLGSGVKVHPRGEDRCRQRDRRPRRDRQGRRDRRAGPDRRRRHRGPEGDDPRRRGGPGPQPHRGGLPGGGERRRPAREAAGAVRRSPRPQRRGRGRGRRPEAPALVDAPPELSAGAGLGRIGILQDPAEAPDAVTGHRVLTSPLARLDLQHDLDRLTEHLGHDPSLDGVLVAQPGTGLDLGQPGVQVPVQDEIRTVEPEEEPARRPLPQGLGDRAHHEAEDLAESGLQLRLQPVRRGEAGLTRQVLLEPGEVPLELGGRVEVRVVRLLEGVGDVDQGVVEVVHLEGLGREPRGALVVYQHQQGVQARHQPVDPQLRLPVVQQEDVAEIALGHVAPQQARGLG